MAYRAIVVGNLKASADDLPASGACVFVNCSGKGEGVYSQCKEIILIFIFNQKTKNGSYQF